MTSASAPQASDRVLSRLMALHPKVIDLVLDRVWRLLADLDHPERRLPPVIHVAGTNGKGSVLANLRAMLEASGLRVHVYTSPHLARFAERIRLAGHLIDEDHLCALLEECERVNQGRPITFFEITTCAAFLAFAREPADVVLLETGLGGRLDATNVVDRPALTVITPIALDHAQFLGNTVAQVAGEKAGILKPGVPCVTAAQVPEAAAVFTARAAEVGAPLLLGDRDWSWEPLTRGRGHGGVDGGFRTLEQGGRLAHEWPAPALRGGYQRANAALAVQAARTLPTGLRPDDAAIARGLRTVSWPGRVQRLDRGALPALLADGWELWLDGGHNPHAGAALAGVLAEWADRPLHMIVGMLDTKDQAGFLAPLLSQAASVQLVPIPDADASVPTPILAERARSVAPADLPIHERSSVAEAVRCLTVEKSPGPKARVLICGSLYLVGAVLRENGTLPD